MHRFRTAVIAISLSVAATTVVSTLAIAQEDMRAKGARLCNGDARRLCKEVLGQGDMVVLSCFQENRTRLSSGCRKFLQEAGQL